MTDKVSPGSKFRGSPLTSAATVNGILDAAEDYTKRRQLGRGVDPIRKTLPTDLVRVRNDSGSDRRAGEVMSVGAAIIDEDQLTNEFLWFQGLAPNTSEKFGILRKPLPEDKIGELQVSGVCKAWVNITDLSHERAKVTPGSYVLTSADTGQFKLLWTPGETGEQDCVVVFADRQGGASKALAKLTANMCPDDECVTVECLTGDCDAPTIVCNKLKLAGQAGNLVVIEKFTPCSAVCDDPYECQIAGCESTEDAYGDSSCGAPEDPCEPFWVITQVEHKTFCPLVDTDLRTPEGAYGLNEGKWLVQGRAAISAMYCAEDVVGEIVGNVCCEESEEESSCLTQLNLEFEFSEAANCDEGPNYECCSEDRDDKPLPKTLYVTGVVTDALNNVLASESFEITYSRTLRKWSGSPTICGTTWEVHMWLCDSPEEYVCENVDVGCNAGGQCFIWQSFCSSYDEAINAHVGEVSKTCDPFVATFRHSVNECAGCGPGLPDIVFTVMEIEP